MVCNPLAHNDKNSYIQSVNDDRVEVLICYVPLSFSNSNFSPSLSFSNFILGNWKACFSSLSIKNFSQRQNPHDTFKTPLVSSLNVWYDMWTQTLHAVSKNECFFGSIYEHHSKKPHALDTLPSIRECIYEHIIRSILHLWVLISVNTDCEYTNRKSNAHNNTHWTQTANSHIFEVPITFGRT